MKRPVASPWSLALHHLAQARGSSWTRGAATGAAWDAVHTGEELLLAAAPCPATVGAKLRYLLAITQPTGSAALRQREQPWRHRLLQSAIEDVAHLGAALAAAQAEAQRLHKGASRSSRTTAGAACLREQLAACRTELGEIAAERDAALDALARANQHHVLAALGITYAGPLARQMGPADAAIQDWADRGALSKKKTLFNINHCKPDEA